MTLAGFATKIKATKRIKTRYIGEIQEIDEVSHMKKKKQNQTNAVNLFYSFPCTSNEKGLELKSSKSFIRTLFCLSTAFEI